MRYYKSISISLLTEDTKSKLVDYISNNPECILNYYRVDGSKPTFYISNKPRNEKDHCSSLKHINLDSVYPIIEKDIEVLRNKISIPFDILILYISPDSIVHPHKDSRSIERQATIIDPVYPNTNYTPTMFFSEKPKHGDKPDSICDTFPALVNIQEYHAVKTYQHFRLNFQIYFGIPYTFDIVSSMIDDGTLYR